MTEQGSQQHALNALNGSTTGGVPPSDSLSIGPNPMELGESSTGASLKSIKASDYTVDKSQIPR